MEDGRAAGQRQTREDVPTEGCNRPFGHPLLVGGHAPRLGARDPFTAAPRGAMLCVWQPTLRVATSKPLRWKSWPVGVGSSCWAWARCRSWSVLWSWPGL